MAITSIESLIYESPSRDDGHYSDILSSLNKLEQQRIGETLSEIRINTTKPNIRNEYDGPILKNLVESDPWNDLLILTENAAEACVNINGNYLVENSGNADIEIRETIMQRLKFLSKGLYLLGRNHVYKMERSIFKPRDTEQGYDIPDDNSIFYEITPSRVRGYNSVQRITVITRKTPERGAEARVGINVQGLTGGGLPLECGISFDQGIKDFSYGRPNQKRLPNIDLRLGQYYGRDLLDNMSFILRSRPPSKEHHFYPCDKLQTPFNKVHGIFRYTLNELYKYNKQPTNKKLFE